MAERPATSDDLAKFAAERDLYRRIDLHQTHVAQSFASDVLPPVPLWPLQFDNPSGCTGECNQGRNCTCRPPVGCHGACAEGECDCSHKSAPRRPRQPRGRPSILAQFWALLTSPRFLP